MRVLLLLIATVPVAAAVPAQIPLGNLAKVARDRAERARPAAEAALEPFLPDLALAYRPSQELLDKRIEAAAALGDSVVPLLLEKLVPNENSEKARNLAGNCRRVLERLDPASFVDALGELLQSQFETTRREALRLLGHAVTPHAERLLLEQLQKTSGEDQQIVLQSLARHRTKAAAEQVVGLLGSADRGLRADVLDYLTAARAGNVADTVVQALAAEKEDYLLPRYIAYFSKAVRQHDGAARALLGLIGQRIDWRDTREIVNALATVAPPDHEPTIRRLHTLLDDEKTSTLAVETAVTLRALGDRQGVARLKRTLDDALRTSKREPALYQQRANLLFAIGDYAEAADDYEKIIEYTGGISMTRLAYMGLIRCEANRRRWTQLARVIKNSPLTAPEIEAMAFDDEVLQEAFAHDRVENAIEQVRKRQAPK